MRRALALARRGLGRTAPNPAVGAVVAKNGKIIGEGWHRKAGGPHAEVFALEQAGEKAEGADLYVTLEPCSHFGKTPPCADLIIARGVSRVFAAMKDPNPLVSGRGLAKLRKAGIAAECGLLGKEAAELNRAWLKFIRTGLPYLTVKAGQSLDGKIATHEWDSKWITSEPARKYSRKYRNTFDAIIAGAETVIRDNPSLSAPDKLLLKVIVDGRLRVSPSSKIFSLPEKVLIACTREAVKATPAKAAALSRKAELLPMAGKNGRIPLAVLMKELGARGVTHALCEGGGTLNGALFDAKLADEVMFYISPMIIGGGTAKLSVAGSGAARMKDAAKIRNLVVKRIGDDYLFRGQVEY